MNAPPRVVASDAKCEHKTVLVGPVKAMLFISVKIDEHDL
jgi:hypothetical protein